jgi:outer membrane autotransporter protein
LASAEGSPAEFPAADNDQPLTLSGETGYAMRAGQSDWVLEPQAQLLYIRYWQDDVTEPNGTRITGQDGSGWVSRAGLFGSATRLSHRVSLHAWQDITAAICKQCATVFHARENSVVSPRRRTRLQ